jgi:glycosyltransferase involved in cell wall biosynthesis
MNKLLFLADSIHLKSEIPGGVQICTHEFIDLLKLCNFDVELFPVNHTRKIFTRMKIKLGIELYTRYDFDKIAQKIIFEIKKSNINYVALNQVDFIKIATFIKKEFKEKVKIIVLSHGNESGDFLHHVVRRQTNWFIHIRDIVRLGFAIYNESKHFIEDIDFVLSISETEKQINNWLGAKNSIFIPRTIKPDFIDWKPILSRVGFVGTLNHKPNIDGLKMLLNELKIKNIGNLEIRIVGGPKEEGLKLEKEYSFVKYVGHLIDSDFKKEVSSWAIFLNPIFWYSRGASTKLAQGIAWGLPIATTEAGNRGYAWKKGSLLVASNSNEMAQQIIDAASDKIKIEKLANETQQVANSNISLIEIAENIKKYFN